ncbi:Error-prone repair protein ImuA [Sphingobacterium oryzagri]|uniref:Error-prone repair protein ImuA n=1 Tax=Sphingobacterium oryzagri TaxID=3025669 RepID=A0ABY7WCK8_9SPHI|nr:Error-prone repair protein ImuA [Sphingobacterium sp. KACC 22765]WDF67205.1 Error-prone repair protein ImuA [Sphingobacterium sp. KACC 22765]
MANKQQVIEALQQKILTWQGYKEIKKNTTRVGFGAFESAFPGQAFPTGTIHEFITDSQEEEAATTGFVGGLLSVLMHNTAVCLWISNSHTVFPAAIQNFGIAPDRIVFVCMHKEQDILWALEESLKCSSLCCVIAEISDLDFIQSRRLQLAVEKSRVTGLLLRKAARVRMSTVCAVRWHVKPLPSKIIDELPGIGFPVWGVNLLKVKNGNPSHWQVTWQAHQFIPERLDKKPVQRSIRPNLKVS